LWHVPRRKKCRKAHEFRIAFDDRYEPLRVENSVRERLETTAMAEASDVIREGSPSPVPIPEPTDDAPRVVTADLRARNSGLKPIARLSSDTRLSKIVPTTTSGSRFAYCSTFVRNFLRSDFNFVSAKVAVARAGKLRAIDEGFRTAESWYAGALAWAEGHTMRPLPLHYDEYYLDITAPLAGRLVRLLNQHDRLFAKTLFCQSAGEISADARATTMEIAAKRVRLVHSLCIPDDDQFAADGTRNADQRQS